MRKLARPTMCVADVVPVCAANIADRVFKVRLNAEVPNLSRLESFYSVLGDDAALYVFKSANAVGAVSKDEMIWVYDNKLSKQEHPARLRFYDVIRSVPHGKCPLCAERIVSTLDHYLGKAEHPAFALTPLNLVPACTDCNFAKSSHSPTTEDEQTLHPYFDDVEDAEWLKAAVVCPNPVTVIFFVTPPTDWPPPKQNRVREHFKVLKLAELYGSNAGSYLSENKGSLICASGGGPDGVRFWLDDCLKSCRAVARNSWKIALFSALANDVGFCAGGYNHIA